MQSYICHLSINKYEQSLIIELSNIKRCKPIKQKLSISNNLIQTKLTIIKYFKTSIYVPLKQKKN